MKKLINDPKSVVAESVQGFGLAHADLVTINEDPTYITRKDAPVNGKVGLVSGGGSGHEPLHAGYVGKGMLDAAVPGAVFTSPTPDQILPATLAVNSGAGVVHIVKNYTGDVLNFETAAELAEAEGVSVRTVLVNDDVAVEDSLYTAGRRGVGGTVLVEKIAGAAAERGDSLDDVASIGERVNANVRTMGVALSACTVPHAGQPSFDLADDEIEIGIGIHGEPGRHRIPLENADGITDRLLEPVLADLNIGSGDKVLLFVNGMGGTPQSELYIVYRRAVQVLKDKGATVERSLVGNYITALEMQGCSISVLRLDDELTELWDAPVHTAALRWGA
ncbi:dihydroxyacetone kinase, DhaK subunit [Pseudarthrobacter chlorophenolicus A6]|uniref:phosphoenolpyruvate--glycerone phosphotransferase n=1 Tax=Pseudarthrobacter chlorophenolicus (strain ATCC 700700 / DSM 12829 / CIP 107037 / JCM 12360 / KCTC 9906 / NCIMB 13794 / A6) TaxID=452863 RepID=B8H9V1_PSECP|nr:dihydroxyacetone kinase subunit DhaK [Pseudarthrobacter chlorophenolicus]ACL38335.1 dihydroxyacetone kinase, DhaK subunit [Pseudarthrobacter chlorophenolicus A6]SDQ50771.1 dihydroxyacetone kinase DhaK subunit [Pseudarthrobacter chlorophenolicus]